MFRRIYWVVEWIHSDDRSEVRGVYTSIPNLVRQGLDHPQDVRLRLTLTKLDCENPPFGTWQGPNFEGMAQRLGDFVQTDEFSKDQVQMLSDTLQLHAVA